MQYTSNNPSSSVDRAIELDLSQEENWKQYLQHTFPEDQSWIPERLEVNGRTGRRAVCIIAEDRMRYRIYDIDAVKRNAEVEVEGRDDVKQATADEESPL